MLAPRHSPLDVGLLYLPELGTAVITAVAFGLVFRSHLIHYFVLLGLAFLAAGIVVLRGAIPPTTALTLVGSGLIGVGIGASVTPALFLVGFSQRSAAIQRVFAILELLRAIAAFLIAPILLHFATTLAGLATPSMGTALWICFGLSAGAALAFVGLYLLGGVRRPAAPALEEWMGGQEPAWDTPPLLAAVRRGPGEPGAGRTPARTWTRPITAGRPAASLIAHRDGQRDRGRGARPGPVLFAYDGSDVAKAAIAEAGHQLAARRDALVLTVWRTFNVGFLPEPDTQFNAACGEEVGEAAEQTAARGASLAESAGFRAQGAAAEGTPAWKAIMDAADDHDASLIVLGSHRRAGLGGLVSGSVAGDVASHSERPVLIVHAPAGAASARPEMSSVAGSSEAAGHDRQG